jgi:hypothetical protein
MLRQAILLPAFSTSKSYWERRYRLGGTSGEGSQGLLAEFKAEVLNAFVQENAVESVIEFGCGDGRQLSLTRYPRYLGQDVSQAAVEMCRQRFSDDASKSFLCYDPAEAPNVAGFLSADLTLSLDVIYHLVEDGAYERYLSDLFTASRRFVIVYSSDGSQKATVPHVRHRTVTADVRRRFPGFAQVRTIQNRYPRESFCEFFIFERLSEHGERK